MFVIVGAINADVQIVPIFVKLCLITAFPGLMSAVIGTPLESTIKEFGQLLFTTVTIKGNIRCIIIFEKASVDR